MRLRTGVQVLLIGAFTQGGCQAFTGTGRSP